MIQWGIVTDETGLDPVGAIQLAAAWGIRTVELRGVRGGQRVPDLEPGEAEMIRAAADEAGITISALSPGTWKCSLADRQDAVQAERFGRTLQLARQMGVSRVITFAVRRDRSDRPDNFEQVIRILQDMAQRASDQGIQLLAENEKDWWLDTPEAIERLMERLAPYGLRLNWDPGNFIDAGGTDTLAATRRFAPWIGNVHCKDACRTDHGLAWCRLGEGLADWPALLPQLLDGGQKTPLTIETHCAPLLANSQANLAYLRRLADTISMSRPGPDEQRR